MNPMSLQVYSISPNATVTPTGTISLTVATHQKNDLITFITNNTTLSHNAFEYIENTTPLMPLDVESSLAFETLVPLKPGPDEDITLIFEQETPFLNRLAPGQALFSFEDGFIAEFLNVSNAETFEIDSIEKTDGEVHLLSLIHI